MLNEPNTWPDETKDDPQSRTHATIQNDGACSLVPRMLDGVTNPSNLRPIVDVEGKYNVQMIKTINASASICRVFKEDLPAGHTVWSRLRHIHPHDEYLHRTS